VKIGIAYSLAPPKSDAVDGPDDRFEEFDRPETVDAIASVIRDDGHEVTLLGDGREFLAKMLADPPEFVFNIAEGSGVSRNREARVPAVCEMLGVPYSGSDPLTLAASLDKEVARTLVGPDVAVPEGMMLYDEGPGALQSHIDLLSISFGPGGPLTDDLLPFPMIFKPAFEGSSKGIRGLCVASTRSEALAIYRRLLDDYRQPVMAERFIDGDEVTVGIVGNAGKACGFRHDLIGLMKILPKQVDGPFVYSLEVKRDWRNRVSYQAPAELPKSVAQAVKFAAISVFGGLGCRDFARIDFRIHDGVPYFIEANPLPGLAPVTSDLVILAEGYGISHAELIRRILHTALQRVGLMERAT
jgi:D-alanine-D-alanine ligase